MKGDLAVLQSVVQNVTELPVTLDQDVASKLSKKDSGNLYQSIK